MNHRHLALVLTSALLAGSAVHAQQIYRIVGPDGKVSFSDKAPTTEQGKVVGTGAGAGAAAAASNLPFELRQIVGKFPVTLYTTTQCAPCDSGRNLLSSRGVPFNEKTITSAEDSAALLRLSGETSLPFLTIGSQKIRGLTSSEWQDYLDAAGYPKASVLPAAFKNAPASPLVAPAKPEPKAEAKQAPAVPAAAPAPSNKDNPAGIVF